MKVILLRDVAKIGRRFEVKDVPGGHALNFLIPRKLAELATPEALRKLSVEMKKKSVMTERHDTTFISTLESLKNIVLEMAVPANEKGHLFKGVHAADIANFLEAQGKKIAPSYIMLKEPLKTIGEYTIPLTSHGITGNCMIRITRA